MSGADPNLPAGEAWLRRQAGPLFAVIERSGMALVATDAGRPDNPVVFVNDAFSVLTGYPKEEVLGRNCRFLQSPKSDPAAIEEMRRAVVRSRPTTTDVLNLRRDGSPFWNRVTITPIPDASQTLFVGTMADVTSEHGRVGLGGAGGTWEWDIAGKLLYADFRFAELCGLDPRRLLLGAPTQTFFAGILPEDRMRIRIAVAGALNGAEVFAKEFRVTGADAVTRWVSARGRVQLDETGEPLRFTGALTDITEQKRVQEQLRIAQTAGGVGSFEYQTGFGTTSVSDEFCRLLGLHRADALPVRTVNALVREGSPPIIDAWNGGEPGNVPYTELLIRRADTGEDRWLARRGELMREGGVTGLRFVGVVYDVTSAKLAEAQLREFADRLEQRVRERTHERDRLWNSSRDLFAVCDQQGIIRAANPAWPSLLGHTPASIIGAPIASLVHPEDLEPASSLSYLDVGETDIDLRFSGADGQFRWISWRAIPDGDDVFLIGRDVTQRKTLEDQLRQSQKMEAIGQLTGGIAHDFNNLLTGIIGSLDLMQTRIAQGRTENIERYARAAMSSANRAAALTHRLLAFARRQPLDPKPVDVNQLISSMEDLLRRTLGETIAIELVTAGGLWTTLCDPNQLESAILNLAINARDAMPGPGRLTIETANAHLDSAYASRQPELTPGQYVALSVTDTGSGMPADVIARAFDPFFTTKPIGQGTGLGLSMVYGFAKQSDGHIRIYSEVGQGTTVKIYLPRYRGAVAEDGPSKSIEVPRAEPGQTVLVVEDEPVVRDLIVEVLQDLGYGAIEASDGPAGLKILQSGRRVDLLVSDVGLPGINGRQLADQARISRPDLKVLFITGYAENATVANGFLEPGMEMITKPFAVEALAIRIRQMIES